MDHLTQSDICECVQQLHPDGAVVRDLIFGHVNDDDANSKLCDILLELNTAIICDEKVELLLRYRQKWTVFHRAPTLIAACRDLMAAEELLHPGIYAFVNEDAHSRICGEVKHGKDLLPCDGWIEHQKLVDGFATFKKIDEALHGYTCAPETRSTAHAPGVYPDRLVQAVSLFSRHILRLSHFAGVAQRRTSGWHIVFA